MPESDKTVRTEIRRLGSIDDWRRALPTVDAVLEHPAAKRAAAEFGDSAVAALARERLEALRVQVGQSSESRIEAIAIMAAAEAERRFSLSPGPVINATGTVVHPNLGRVPLADAALEAMLRVGLGYSALDYDLEQGSRGSRSGLLAPLLGQLTGADDGVVVNSYAGALQLALSAIARGREVIVPRAHTIEFGGGYALPASLQQSGVEIVEVGTSSRTRLSDYVDAITPRTAALVFSHPHHPRSGGIGDTATLPELVALGHRNGIPVLDELGSGCLLETAELGLPVEARVQEAVEAGAEIVCFSGDRLLGGPQSGIIVGGSDYIARIRRHGLLRILRVDKITIAALHATLLHYLRGEAVERIPVWIMLCAALPALEKRAAAWRGALTDVQRVRLDVVPSRSSIRGGASPGETLPTQVLSLRAINTTRGWSAQLAGALRRRPLPLLARVENNAVLLDPRTVQVRNDPDVIAALREVLHDA